MSIATAPEATGSLAAYGLERPTVGSAHAAIERVCRGDADAVWAEIEREADHLAGTDRFDRIVAAMKAHRDAVVRLCAQSLIIRSKSYAHLAATNAIVNTIA